MHDPLTNLTNRPLGVRLKLHRPLSRESWIRGTRQQRGISNNEWKYQTAWLCRVTVVGSEEYTCGFDFVRFVQSSSWVLCFIGSDASLLCPGLMYIFHVIVLHPFQRHSTLSSTSSPPLHSVFQNCRLRRRESPLKTWPDQFFSLPNSNYSHRSKVKLRIGNTLYATQCLLAVESSGVRQADLQFINRYHRGHAQFNSIFLTSTPASVPHHSTPWNLSIFHPRPRTTPVFSCRSFDNRNYFLPVIRSIF